MKNSTHLSKNAGIYILTNTLNSKQYVGMDSNMPRRFKQHTRGIAKCGLLHDALSAIGLEHWRTSDILKHSKFTRQGITIALKSLMEKELITKVKRGHYQKSDI